MTPTQRTMRWLRDGGHTVGIVERWVGRPGTGARVDLFNFIDMIAIGPDGIVGVQSCGQAFSEHAQKILEAEHLEEWLTRGGKLWLIGWRQVKRSKGGKAMKWEPRVREFTLDDLS